ncbi:MAG: hypothetical protein ACKERG_04430 [Candidatus Hodgkinia cicadicola]
MFGFIRRTFMIWLPAADAAEQHQVRTKLWFKRQLYQLLWVATVFGVGIDDGVKTELSKANASWRGVWGLDDWRWRRVEKEEWGSEGQLHGFEPNQTHMDWSKERCVFHGRSMSPTAIRAGS